MSTYVDDLFIGIWSAKAYAVCERSRVVLVFLATIGSGIIVLSIVRTVHSVRINSSMSSRFVFLSRYAAEIS